MKEWTNKRTGKEESRHGPMYIYFHDDRLQRFDGGSHCGLNESFECGKITIDNKEQSELNEIEGKLSKNRLVCAFYKTRNSFEPD